MPSLFVITSPFVSVKTSLFMVITSLFVLANSCGIGTHQSTLSGGCATCPDSAAGCDTFQPLYMKDYYSCMNCTDKKCSSNPCHVNANCTDTAGSFVCQCNAGFSGNGSNCSNVNECLTSPCHPNASCTDTEGSFVCQCNVGFSGNGLNCSNINECLTSPCHHNASCTDTEGSFVCQCNVGFSGNGLNCSNVNECLTSPCHHNANCTDTQGSYDCKCNVGFSGNGVTCANIDECLSKPCHVNASCTDSEGSYGCQCNPGFSGNGISNCTNIDECLNVSCHVNADCLDTPGSYICRCKTGFNGNGTFCESDPSEQGGMNLTMVIGIPIALISLLLIARLIYLYRRRVNKRCCVSQICCVSRLIPTQHGEDHVLDMEDIRILTESQPLSQPPPATADDQQYHGPEISPALDKDNQADPSLLC